MFDLISSHEITTLLATYGYLAVLTVVAIESMGVPVPGEMTLILASIYAGTTHHLHIALVILAAGGGAVLGDNLGFLIGREGGYRLLHRYGKYVRLDENKLGLSQQLFDTHGGKMVFFGRFLPVLRIWAAFLAGAHRMPWRRFLAFNAAGGITWATLMGLAGYTFGSTVLKIGGPVGIAAGLVSTLAMVGVGLVLHRNQHRLERKPQHKTERKPVPIEVCRQAA